MSLIVQKFGGSSVRDAERVMNVARRVIETYKAGNDVVVVVSAQGDTTDDLIAKANEIAASHDFDFVLGSVHVMNGREVDDTLYLEQDEREVYRAYLLEAAMLLETADVDAFAGEAEQFDDITMLCISYAGEQPAISEETV